MLILPLQGVAAAFVPLHQARNPAPAMPCHEAMTPGQSESHDPAARAMHHAVVGEHAPPADGLRDADGTNHLCCHQIFTCANVRVSAVPSLKFGDVTRFVPLLATLFIPDAPDRPPRG